jgi:hypothetical protein
MNTGELVLTIGLSAVALIVMFGGPIWFSLKARPLGPLPYRWGTFVGIWSLLISFGLLGTILNNRKNSELPIFAVIPVLGMAGAIGILRRKRWGVVSFLVSQAVLILLGVLFQDSDEAVKPALRALGPVSGIGINLWYFGRRWRLLSRPIYEDYADSVTASEEPDESDQSGKPQPPQPA